MPAAVNESSCPTSELNDRIFRATRELVDRVRVSDARCADLTKDNAGLRLDANSARLANSVLREANARLADMRETAERNFQSANVTAGQLAKHRDRLQNERDEAVLHATKLAEKYDKDLAEARQLLAEANLENERILKWANGLLNGGTIQIRVVK